LATKPYGFPIDPVSEESIMRSWLTAAVATWMLSGCAASKPPAIDASAIAAFHCADHIKAVRTDTTVEYMGTDEHGFCRLRYGNGPVRHRDLIFGIASWNQDEFHEVYVALILTDPPGQQRTTFSRGNRGGASWTYTVVDRDDYSLDGATYHCVHYTARQRYGPASAYQDIISEAWVDSTSGVMFRYSGRGSSYWVTAIVSDVQNQT
jgi:hypothetical protein